MLQPRGWPGGRASPPAGSCWTGLSSELALPGGNNCSPQLLGLGSLWSLLMSPGSSGRVGAERRQRPHCQLVPVSSRGPRALLSVGGGPPEHVSGWRGWRRPRVHPGLPSARCAGLGWQGPGQGGRVWLQRSDVPGSGQGWKGGPRGQSPRGPTCLRSGVSLRPAHPPSQVFGPRPSRTSLMRHRARRVLYPGGPRGRGTQPG